MLPPCSISAESHRKWWFIWIINRLVVETEQNKNTTERSTPHHSGNHMKQEKSYISRWHQALTYPGQPLHISLKTKAKPPFTFHSQRVTLHIYHFTKSQNDSSAMYFISLLFCHQFQSIHTILQPEFTQSARPIQGNCIMRRHLISWEFLGSWEFK